MPSRDLSSEFEKNMGMMLPPLFFIIIVPLHDDLSHARHTMVWSRVLHGQERVCPLFFCLAILLSPLFP